MLIIDVFMLPEEPVLRMWTGVEHNGANLLTSNVLQMCGVLYPASAATAWGQPKLSATSFKTSSRALPGPDSVPLQLSLVPFRLLFHHLLDVFLLVSVGLYMCRIDEEYGGIH